MQKKAKELLHRLFPNQSDQDDKCQVVSDQNTKIVQEKTISEKLENFIQELTYVTSKKLPNISSFIDKEFNVFAATEVRTPNLELLYNTLLTIPPTSVEAERAFSAAELFITKLRSRLSDNSIDALCFLRTYYIQKGKINA